jgi:hypothetical protein
MLFYNFFVDCVVFSSRVLFEFQHNVCGHSIYAEGLLCCNIFALEALLILYFGCFSI